MIKQRWYFGLMFAAMQGVASEHSDSFTGGSYYPILHIDGSAMTPDRFCVYSNTLYSEGAEIMMATQRFFRCERVQQGKTKHDGKVNLRWKALDASSELD